MPMKKDQISRSIQIKVLKKGEMLQVRWKNSSFAQRNLSTEQVHRRILKNGASSNPNRFYDGRKTAVESYRMLNTAD